MKNVVKEGDNNGLCIPEATTFTVRERTEIFLSYL